MKKKMKKAFTLVELLVVIAILAVLSTVAIVGYNSFTDKANKSADEQAVTQMNKLLLAQETAGEKPQSVGEVTVLLRENGYSENFQTYFANYDLAWIAEENVIVLVEEDEIVYPESYTSGTYAFVVLNPYSEDVGELIDTKNEVKDGDTINIKNDIIAANSDDLVFDRDNEYNVELNGNKLYSNESGIYVSAGDVTFNGGHIETGADVKSSFAAYDGGNATLKDMIITGGQNNGTTIGVNKESTLVVENSRVYGNEGTNPVQCYGGTLVLNDVVVSQVGDAEESWYSSAVQVINTIVKVDGKWTTVSQANAEINGGTYIGDKAIQISAPGGNVTITDGTFTGSTWVIQDDFAPNYYRDGANFESVITISGGTYKGAMKTSKATVLVITGGSFDGSLVKVESTNVSITGGTFTNSGFTAEQFDEKFVPAGYVVTEANGVLTVSAA